MPRKLFLILLLIQVSKSYLSSQSNQFPPSGNSCLNCVTPLESFQIGDRWTFHNGGSKFIGLNSYYNQNDKRILNGASSQIRFHNDGSLQLRTAPYGLGNSIINFNLGLTLNADGNVGIGTLSPQGTLHLIKDDPSIILDDNFGSVGSPDLGFSKIANSNGTLRIQSDKSVSIFLDLDNNDTDNSENNAFRIVSNNSWFGESIKTNFSVLGNGDVNVYGKLILGDVSTPGNYSIYADKGILTEKVTIALKNSSDWADYVFEPNYKILPLNELKKFIDINRHLPNLLPASEMLKQGNNLHNTDVKLLEKIEELTLYLIELNEAIKILQEKVNNAK